MAPLRVSHPTNRVPAAVDTEGQRSPVFVDPSGRRRVLTKLLGAGAGGVLVLLLALVGAGLFGASPVSLPGWPAADAGRDPEHAGPPTGGAVGGTSAPATRTAAHPGPTVGTPGAPVATAPVPGASPAGPAAPTANPGSTHRSFPTAKPSHGRP